MLLGGMALIRRGKLSGHRRDWEAAKHGAPQTQNGPDQKNHFRACRLHADRITHPDRFADRRLLSALEITTDRIDHRVDLFAAKSGMDGQSQTFLCRGLRDRE